jgi:hypothetical protein
MATMTDLMLTPPAGTVFHGSAADTNTVARAMDILLVDTCVACLGPGAVYGYWMCVPCLEA